MKPEAEYLEQLVRFVAETAYEDIPLEVLASAKDILIDSLPVYATGMRAPELVALTARQLESAAPGRASVIGSGRCCNPMDAAMLNGIAGAWLDFDEGNFLANGHPGMQVIPAALAVAQERRISGRELLATIVLSYEVVARIGMATKVKLIVNPHGTFGVVGAALATARLTGMAPDKLRNLASLAASTCVATNRHTMLDGATVRNWYAGHSGFMGQMAVRLAEAGFSGPADGVNTTFSLVLGDGFDRQVAVAGLGERWLLREGYIKLYPTARYVHSAIDALFDALGSVPDEIVQPADVVRIDVRAYRLAAFLSNKSPKDWFGTRFSIPFALATLLVGGRTGLAAFGDEAVADPVVMGLSQKVEVTEDEVFTQAYPAAQRVELVIHLRNGRQLSGRCEITSGEPGRPHPPELLVRKFRELAEPLWGVARADALRNALMNIESCEDVSLLTDFKL